MNQLVSLLKKEPIFSIEDIGRTLNLSSAEVNKNMTELEKKGVILGYHAVIHPDHAAGDVVTAIVEIKITPERGGGFDRLASRIAKFEQVQSCYLMSGGYDLLISVRGKDLQEIASFIAEKLSTIKGVLSTATHFQLKTYKEHGIPLYQEESLQRLPVAP